MTLDPERVAAFWRFICERHAIFVRRHLRHEPPPWTQDPLLQNGYFCNIYRDLDRVTRWLTINVLPGGAKAPALSAEDCAFNVLVYRRFCRPDVFMEIGGARPMRVYDWDAVSATLRKREQRGERLFTGAFILSNAGSHQPKRELVTQHLRQTANMWSVLWPEVAAAGSLEVAHSRLLAPPGMGPFLAYEALIDYCNARLVRHSLDDWAYIGPGALRGAALVYGREMCRRAALELASHLRDEQEMMRRTAGVMLAGPRLTLENIEQALCEWAKYNRLLKTGRIKRRYAVSNDDLGPWADLPGHFVDECRWDQQGS